MNTKKTSKPINVTLWVLQALVGVAFIMAGFMKLTMPIAKLSAMLPWTGQVPAGCVRLLAIVDLLGGFGLILPAALRIKPQLTIWAAIGITTLMLCAIIFHVSRGEGAMVAPNIIIALITAVIGWGRTMKAIIPVTS